MLAAMPRSLYAKWQAWYRINRPESDELRRRKADLAGESRRDAMLKVLGLE
jgi:hypothetical protein